jgi:hypothetical protein
MEDRSLWHVYHYLWGKATDAVGYQKGPWNQLHARAYLERDTTKDTPLRQHILSLARSQGVSESDIATVM